MGFVFALVTFTRVFALSKSIGKVGKESAAAKLASATPSNDFSIQEDKPYAEVRLRLCMMDDLDYDG